MRHECLRLNTLSTFTVKSSKRVGHMSGVCALLLSNVCSHSLTNSSAYPLCFCILKLNMRFCLHKGSLCLLISFLALILTIRILFIGSGSEVPSTLSTKIEVADDLGRLDQSSASAHIDADGKEQQISSACDVVIACILCEDTISITSDETDKPNQIVARDFTRQLDQIVVLLKSIVISSKYSKSNQGIKGNNKCTKVIIISDNREHFETVMDIIYEEQKWSEEFLKYLRFVHFPVTYPPGTSWMKKLFRPCATLRLFLPDILPHTYQNLIYLDTDIIFLRDIHELRKEFNQFSTETIAAMSPCLFHYGTRANKIPYYGTSGLNAGIMLMNLTRMRETLWTRKIKMVTEIFQHDIKLADQDILNIYFHFFPDHLHQFSCSWNFRPWNCHGLGSKCQDVENISALHGNALSFTVDGSEPWFFTIFQQYRRMKLNNQFSIRGHVERLQNLLESKSTKLNSHCFQQPDLTQAVLNRLQNLIGQE